ncbi:unnamed protein product, partial [Mesorhabditis spiculigera]
MWRPTMKLGLQLGYWGARPPANAPGTDRGSGRRGIRRAVFAGGVDLGPRTSVSARPIVQISARTADQLYRNARASLLDHLNGGRTIPRARHYVRPASLVEGWYGQPFEKPLARTREYVSIVLGSSPVKRQSPAPAPTTLCRMRDRAVRDLTASRSSPLRTRCGAGHPDLARRRRSRRT